MNIMNYEQVVYLYNRTFYFQQKNENLKIMCLRHDNQLFFYSIQNFEFILKFQPF